MSTSDEPSRGATAPPAPAAAVDVDERRILEVVRELALELSGDRAAQAVVPTASLERDIGLGSLERVELLTRLETVFQRELGDRFLVLDSPREIARALAEAPGLTRAGPTAPAAVEHPATASDVSLDDVATLVAALCKRATVESARVHVHLRARAPLRCRCIHQCASTASRSTSSGNHESSPTRRRGC
jgi:hypothetical protein